MSKIQQAIEQHPDTVPEELARYGISHDEFITVLRVMAWLERWHNQDSKPETPTVQSKTYLDYEYELRPYKVKITRIGNGGKAQEVEITQYYYTRVDAAPIEPGGDQ